jgi:hypothetical protein
VLRQAALYGIHLRACLRDVDTILQPSKDLYSAVPTLLRRPATGPKPFARQRLPVDSGHTLVRVVESRRHYANNRVRRVAQYDAAANDAWRRFEARRPQFVTDNCVAFPSCLSIDRPLGARQELQESPR